MRMLYLLLACLLAYSLLSLSLTLFVCVWACAFSCQSRIFCSGLLSLLLPPFSSLCCFFNMIRFYLKLIWLSSIFPGAFLGIFDLVFRLLFTCLTQNVEAVFFSLFEWMEWFLSTHTHAHRIYNKRCVRAYVRFYGRMRTVKSFLKCCRISLALFLDVNIFLSVFVVKYSIFRVNKCIRWQGFGTHIKDQSEKEEK